ncbi:hypothetical protein [Kocuria sp. SM24M-10]|uniref:hypothetical protein n=1 Tax=Kocuria sp. SM24M-10 TaxID=1660349 RepID=UPI0013649F43|nr:hypothetical protein [Kocuria sp. SM24M-10]
MIFQDDGWPDGGPRPARPIPQKFDGDDEAVDLFDATARIEARGYSDRIVHGKYVRL